MWVKRGGGNEERGCPWWIFPGITMHWYVQPNTDQLEGVVLVPHFSQIERCRVFKTVKNLSLE